MVTSADKGNSVVILPIQQYQLKIHNFITNNSFQIAKTNPTKTYQNQIRKTINNSTQLIKPEHRWKYVNLNPTEPTIRGLIKLHTKGQPIRPIVNWQHAPPYKLAKLLTEKLQQLASLPYAYNIKNTSQLIKELKQTPPTPTSAFASLDITNMYSNIPTEETKYILYNSLTRDMIDQHTITELINWYEIVTQQNYLKNNDQIIIQKDGLAMGAPSSSITSEIFLQNIEQKHLPSIAKKLNLTNYFRYVDDILIVYDTQQTDITSLLSDFDSLHPKLQFTIETEHNNQINYLDITIHRQQTKVKIAIYRKPTYTDTIIPFNSNHPTQHKYAAVGFLQNRLNTYNLLTKEFREEENIIQNILYNNAFHLQTQPSRKKHITQTRTISQNRTPLTSHTPQTQHSTTSNKYWCTFTYTGKETTFITKLFKHTNMSRLPHHQ